MIYLDNGATSFPKLRGMVRAMEECLLTYCGNPGRSGHYMSMRTGEEVYKVRKQIGSLIGARNPERIIFTKNTTEALNLGLKGVVKGGDHVITSSMEHNSVLRPLKALEKKGVSHSIIRAGTDGTVNPLDVEKAIRPNTRLIVITAASNVTGTKMPLAELAGIARKRGILFMVDGAQGVGNMMLDVNKIGIDIFAAPGHKGLLGPQGTGFLYVRPNLELEFLTEGGTGTDSKSRLQPKDFPDGYEAGTINSPSIIGLGVGTSFVEKIGPEVIGIFEEELITYLEEDLYNMNFIRVYGPKPKKKTGITLFNMDGVGPEELTDTLGKEYGIAVRGGFHCAGLAHKTIGTWNSGAVRVSVGPFNRKKDMKYLVDALWKIYRN
ncbi:MAG: aminotransferase class V-fold PLP-dependent enzyme [Firmicutes bacterium]|nr:aminotransferase class V-fold PLP-dependent enzyme [Bacillota bacterium]